MLVFFLFTGIAIQVYTNVRPFEPRERDYSVVGFYVCPWIGIAFMPFMTGPVNTRNQTIVPLAFYVWQQSLEY